MSTNAITTPTPEAAPAAASPSAPPQKPIVSRDKYIDLRGKALRGALSPREIEAYKPIRVQALAGIYGVAPDPPPPKPLPTRLDFYKGLRGQALDGTLPPRQKAEYISLREEAIAGGFDKPEAQEVLIKPPAAPLLIKKEIPEGVTTTTPDGLIRVERGLGLTYWRKVDDGFVQTLGSGVAVLPLTKTTELKTALADYSQSTGFTQFRKAIEIGLIPTGSIYVPGEKRSEWSYLTQTQANKLRERSPVLHEVLVTEGWDAYNAKLTESAGQLSKFIARGELDIIGAVKAGFSFGDMRNAGFEVESKDIKGIKSRIVAFDKLSKFVTKDELDVIDAVKAGFSFDDINKAGFNVTSEGIKEVEDRIIAFNNLSSFITKDELNVTNALAAGITLDEIKKAGFEIEVDITVPQEESRSRLSGIWQSLTPWDENKGGTFLDHVRNSPKQFISPDIPDQEGLKTRYDAEQSAPLWSRILFGDTVKYDKANDRYLQLFIAETPGVGKKGVTVGATRVATETIPINWNKLNRPDVIKPKIDWNKIVQAIKSGEVRDSKSAARWAEFQAEQAAQKIGVQPLRPGTPEQQAIQLFRSQQGRPGIGTARAAARARQLLNELGVKSSKQLDNIINEATQDAIRYATWLRQYQAVQNSTIARVPSVGSPANWKPFKPSELNATRMAELVADWAKMKPAIALNQINDANLVTAVAAYEPDFLNNLLTKVQPEVSFKTASRLQPDIQKAIRTDNLTRTKTLAQTQLKVSNQLAPAIAMALDTATLTATQAMTKSLTSGETIAAAQVDAQAAVNEAVLTQLKLATQLETATAQQVKSALQAITQTAIHVATQTAVQVKPTVITTTATATELGAPPLITEPPPKITPPKTPPPPIKLRRSRKEEKASREVIKRAGGAIAFRMGELQGKDIFHVVKHPYQSEEDYITVVGKKPAGATVAKGKGSAFRTIKVIRGKRPTSAVSIDIGIQDVLITPRGRGVTIGFTPDPKQQTTSNITVGKKKLSLTSRLPALSKGRRPRLSTKRPRLRG